MKAVFLDRDGTINEDESGQCVMSVEEFSFIEGAPRAMADLCRAGFKVFVITNQAVIGQGLLETATFNRISAHMKEKVAAAGGRIASVYHCPHLPEDGCACRKPETGMIDQALREHPDIDVSESFLVGDRASDIELGQRAGLRTILVLTGEGFNQRPLLHKNGTTPERVVPSLVEAAEYILKRNAPC